MNNHDQLMTQWRDVRADLDAAQNALPPLAEVEAALRETLEAAVDVWHRFTGRIAAELSAGDGRTHLRHLAGGVAVSPDLALAGAIAAHGIDRLLKQARDEAGKLPQPVRLSAGEKAEALAVLRRQRYALELDLATAHFEAGEPLPEGLNAAALLGVPVEVAEAHGLLVWGD